ncbi:hypothetical protein GCM10010270_80500 [Streptomyces violaceus]|nr:hypothetical protein GCM10010270_80500 [Streptomyces janthinus]
MLKVGPGMFLCENCHEQSGLDGLVPERTPQADNGLTRPTGDPREAGHGSAA